MTRTEITGAVRRRLAIAAAVVLASSTAGCPHVPPRDTPPPMEPAPDAGPPPGQAPDAGQAEPAPPVQDASAAPGAEQVEMVPPEQMAALAPVDRIQAIDDRVAPGLSVEMGCSETELRTPVATVTWRAERPSDARMRVDVAASKQGFARGHFVKMMLGPDTRVERSAGMATAEKTLGRALELRMDKPDFDTNNRLMRVRVMRMEPGLVYFWRVARQDDSRVVASAAVRVEVPPCVADIVEERR